MGRTERREQLLTIAHELFNKAESQSDLTVSMIAAKGEVSKVWVTELIGPEYKELKAKLKAAPGPAKTVEGKLRQQIKAQKERIKQLEAIIEANAHGDFAETVRHLELVDAECRKWRGLAEFYEKRLKEAEVIIDATELQSVGSRGDKNAVNNHSPDNESAIEGEEDYTN